MSSDGDDEDELLQIALREQAERDLNYHKPAKQQAAKPVQNYVQTPAQCGGDGTPARSLNNSTMAAAKQQKSRSNQLQQVQRKVVEEDDDSEVEILSISSGDEDPSSKDMARFGVRGRAGSGGGGREGRDEDRGWDGGEPDCWKRVDESEVWKWFNFFCFKLWLKLIFAEFVLFANCRYKPRYSIFTQNAVCGDTEYYACLHLGMCIA